MSNSSIFENDIDSVLSRSVAVPAKDLKLKSRRMMTINGRNISLSSSACADLVKLLGLTDKVATSLDIIMTDGNVVDGLMNLLIQALGKTSTEFMLVFDENKCVQRICSHAEFTKLTSRVAQGTMKSIMEGLMNEYPDLELVDVHTTNGGTTTTFNIIDSKSMEIGIRGEDINFGKQIVWDFIDPTTCSDYVNRMVCMNGMTRFLVQGPTKYLTNQTDPQTWFKEIYGSLVGGTESKLDTYKRNVLNSMTNNLSVREWETIHEIASSRFKTESASKKIIAALGDASWKTDYLNTGLNLDTLTAAKKANCPTPINSWDGVNLLTNLATHETTYGPDKNKTMAYAGKLLTSAWDAAGHIFNTPRYTQKALVLS